MARRAPADARNALLALVVVIQALASTGAMAEVPSQHPGRIENKKAPEAQTVGQGSIDYGEAREDAKAKVWGERARRAFQDGDYLRCVDFLKRAYSLVPDPDFLLGIAVCYDAQPHRCQVALSYLERFFDGCSDCQNRAEGERFAAEIRKKCSERGEAARPQAPSPSSGHPPGQTVDPSGRREPGDAPDAGPLHPAAGANAPAQTGLGRIPKASWWCAGAGVAGLVVGTAFVLLGQGTLNEEEAAREGSSPRPLSEIRALRRQADREFLIAHLGFGVGALGVVAALVFWWLDAPSDAALVSVGAPSQGGLKTTGLQVRVRF